MGIRRLCSIGLTAFLLLAVAGCKEGGPRGAGYIAKVGQERIRTAVIPFESASLQFENAGQVVTQEVVTTLLGTGLFDVIEPGAIFQAMAELGVRNGYGLGPATMQSLQDKIGPVQIFVVGLVQEFGEVRIGPASYPSISINARVLDAQTGSILWSGSISRTGADTEKFFGLGAVHSPGRLARAAVRDLIGSVNRRELAKLLQPSGAVGTGGVPAHALPPRPVKPTGKERYLDETATYSEASLKALLIDVAGLTKGPVQYREHHFAIVEATYQGQTFEIHAKLVDYRKVETALAFVKLEHPGETEGQFVGLPSYAGVSAAQTPGGYHLDIAVGRFGLFLFGPSQRQSEIEKVARAIIEVMK